MATIHPTSIVDKRAELASDVRIGPWCLIEGAVRMDSGTQLLANVHLRGPLVIGTNNTFYPFSVIGHAPQDRSFDPQTDGAGIVIGSGNVFRSGVTIDRATKERPTTVGNENYFMVNTHLGHDGVVHNRCTLANGALLAGHVELFDGVVLGGNAVVHQFCRLGRFSMIAGNRGVTKDLPPFCICWDPRTVSMLNLVGLRRAGHRDSVKKVQKAFDLLYRHSLPTPKACDRIEQELGDDPLCMEMVNFCRAAKRGIAPYSPKSDTGELEG